MQSIDALVNRFLAWNLPDSVCSDPCVTIPRYPLRSGTNLLTADEARQMIKYLLAPTAAENTERRLQKLKQLGFGDAADYATRVIREVAELPDRTSPEDQPEMMLVSADELRTILSGIGTQISDEQ